MAVNLNQEPYFDDYDESKSYYRVLFVPENSVQVREMNQLQSMIHTQVKGIGNHIFNDGSMVIPGGVNYSLEYPYVKIDALVGTDVNTIEAREITLTGTSGLQAKMVHVIDAENLDPVTFYVKYTNTANDNVTKEFAPLESIEVRDSTDALLDTVVCSSTGLGSVMTVNEGVYYANGYFISVDTANVILDKYDVTPSFKVGFQSTESVVSYNDDQTLLDNASGTPNYTAPGADRLKIKFDAVKIGLDEELSDFYEIFRIENGILQKKARGPEYSILGDTMAKRTYDESGDYTVEPFQVSVDTNTDESKFSVLVGEGRAYVKGFEVENISTRVVAVDKARTSEVNNNSAFSAIQGFYVEVQDLSVLPSIKDFITVSFYDDVPASPGSLPAGNLLGTAKVKSIAALDPSFYGLYIFDLKDTSGNQSSTFVELSASVYYADTNPFTAVVYNPGGAHEVAIRDPSNYSMVFPLPNNNVKTLLDVNSNTDTSYTIIKQVDGVTDASGLFVYNASANEIFTAQNSLYSFASINADNTIVDYTSSYTLSGSPAGKTITIDFGIGNASKSVRINIVTIKQTATHKTKALTAGVVANGTIANSKLSLSKTDVQRIVSIIDDSNAADITDNFKLIKNATPTFYDLSYIELKRDYTIPSDTITVNFEYFVHGAGDYFSVDSYSSIVRDDIPVEIINGNEYSMADVLDFRPTISSDGTGFINTGSSTTVNILPNSIIRADVEYYLPRIDKLFVDHQGSFDVIKGIPSLTPEEPTNPDNSMTIAQFYVPPYTNNIDIIDVVVVNNRRYTMRDIGKIEDRIGTLEYYIALNSLEKSTTDLQVIDPVTGLNRFKNGFITDSFTDHSVGNFTEIDYRCAMSSEDRELRPEFFANSVDLQISASSTGVIEHDNLITLPYTDVSLISQLKATNWINVNPFAVRFWQGALTISPNSDTWFETRYSSPFVTYQVFNNGRLTQSWNSWSVNWSGSSSSRTIRSSTDWSTRSNVSGNRGSGRRTVFGTTTTTNTTSVNTSVRVVGDRVVRTDVIPFMRSRWVRFTGRGFRPQTRLYAFFDGINVTAYCNPTTITSDSAGDVSGWFRIPNTNSLKFKTGTRTFELMDVANGDVGNAGTLGEDDYSAKGLLITRRQDILATRSIRRTRSVTSATTGTRTRWSDPIAQSFLISEEEGVFLSKVDIFFRRKDASIPVSVELREMVNGFPGPAILPYSQVLKNAWEVSTSWTGSSATTFTFSDPVYLSGGTEYCVVVKTSSLEYEMYIATIGNREIINNRYVSKQPYVGVMFKSQNNSTWTEDQLSDIKFNLYKAQFTSGSTGTAKLENIALESVLLENNPIASTSGSSIVDLFIANHGLLVGSRIELTGAVDGNGFTAVALNTTHDVTAIGDNNIVKIDLTTLATDTGRFGADSIYSSVNYQVDVFKPTIANLNFASTQIGFDITSVSSKSISGTESPFNLVNGYDISNDGNNTLNAPWVVLSQNDEDKNYLGNKSLELTCTMSTDSVHVSPVLDKNRMSMVTVNNIINSPSSLDESVDREGNSIARYKTLIIGLNEPATSLKTFVDLNKPQDTDFNVYYRTGSTNEEVEANVWSLLDTVSEQTAVDDDVFYESEYEKEVLAPFSKFQMKIVMLSTSSSNVPRAKNFRTLALGT